MAELKPCPFCGWNKARIYSRYQGMKIRFIDDYRLTAEDRRYYVRCNRCYAHGGAVSGYRVVSFVKCRAIRIYDQDSSDSPFVDDETIKAEEAKKPDLPDWVSTKEALHEKAIARWNRREGEI